MFHGHWNLVTGSTAAGREVRQRQRYVYVYVSVRVYGMTGIKLEGVGMVGVAMRVAGRASPDTIRNGRANSEFRLIEFSK